MSIVYRVPPALAARGVQVRLQTEADLDFVREIYVSHRKEEMLGAGEWTPQQQRAFLEDQFRLQWQHYCTFYHDSEFLIIEVGGTPAGRLYLFHNNTTELRIVEIGFMPDWRGKGFGGGLLAGVQAQAAAAGKKCSIHVENSNPALRLYERLGFRKVKPVGPYYLLEWPAVTT